MLTNIKQLLFLSKHRKNNLVNACSKINWWKVSLPCISSKNIELAGISTCRGVFSLLRLRLLRSPVSALWLSRDPLVSLDACKSLKIWLVGTSASDKTTFPELSRRSDVKALKEEEASTRWREASRGISKAFGQFNQSLASACLQKPLR